MNKKQNLKNWPFQQRDSLINFFQPGDVRQDSNHISHLLKDQPAIQYEGLGSPTKQFIGQYHHTPSSVVELHFSVHLEEKKVPFLFPCEDGIFKINGQEYFIPIQRVIWDSDNYPDSVQYRLIEHILMDVWNRRLQKGVENGKTYEYYYFEKFAESEPAEAFNVLRRFLCRFLHALSPNHYSQSLFFKLIDGNSWGALAKQVQVCTFGGKLVEGEKGGDADDIPFCKRHYSRLTTTANYKEEKRAPRDGLDPFHTPEADNIGLTRYLSKDTYVGEDGMLKTEQQQQDITLLPRCIPFLQHNDPRRVLMGCSMMAQAQALQIPEEPLIMTKFERRVRETVPYSNNNLGVNLRVGFMFWKGLNYEDAIVVSKSAAKKLHVKETKAETAPVPAYAELENITDETFENGVRRKGSRTSKRDNKLLRLCYRPSNLGLGYYGDLPGSLQKKIYPFKENIRWEDSSISKNTSGKVIDVTEKILWDKNTLGSCRYSKRFDFTIETERPLQVGDKLCNRHGNKGVVSAIVPDKEMPKVNGESLEVLFSPIGVINRGNYGQVLEAISAPIGAGKKNIPAGLTDAPEKRMDSILQDEELVYDSVEIPDDKGGKGKRVKAVTGMNYILRLPQHAQEKFNVHTEGKYSSITGQPPRGVAQKYGEMEIWALQAHGAHHVLSELNKRSKDSHSTSQEEGEVLSQRALREWLASVGLEVARKREEVYLQKIDFSSPPENGRDLFDTELVCDGDPLAEENKDKGIKKKTLDRRIDSEDFFQEKGGPIYIDFGKELSVTANFEDGYEFEGRYLQVLPPKYRQNPTTRGEHEITQSYKKLAGAIRNKKGKEDDIKNKLKGLLYLLLKEITESNNDRKEGKICRIGLCRRLDYSARMVIVPDPELNVDEVAIPWEAARILYNSKLQKGDFGLTRNPGDNTIKEATELLNGEWVLVNRQPTLHKYNVMAFRPSVHNDGWVLKVPPFMMSPFNADADGDEMTVLPLYDEASKKEAENSLSIKDNLISEADGSLVAAPGKDYLLGLTNIFQSEETLSLLSEDLAAKDVRFEFLPKTKADIDSQIKKMIKTEDISPGQAIDCLDILSKHAACGLNRVTKQSAFGDSKGMEKFYRSMIESGAVKKEKMSEDVPLMGGIPLNKLDEPAEERIRKMIIGKAYTGNFGGVIRRLCFSFASEDSSGLAFNVKLQEGIVAAQSITERATQLALSPKGGDDPLEHSEFAKKLTECLECEGELQEVTKEFQGLCEDLGFVDQPSVLKKHLEAIRAIKEEKLSNFMLVFCDPSKGLTQRLPIKGSAKDPRIAFFLA